MKKKLFFAVALAVLISAFPLNGFAASFVANGRIVAALPANTYATVFIDLADLLSMYSTGERYDYMTDNIGYPITVKLDKDARFGFDLDGNSPFKNHNGQDGTWSGYKGDTNDIYAALVALNTREGHWNASVGPAFAVSVDTGWSAGSSIASTTEIINIPDVTKESWYGQINTSDYFALFNSAPANYIITWNVSVINQQELRFYIQVFDVANGVMTSIPYLTPGNVVVPIALPIYISDNQDNWTATISVTDVLNGGLELSRNKPSFPEVIPTPAPTATPEPEPADPSLVTVSNLQVKKSSVSYNLPSTVVNKIKVPEMNVEIKSASAVKNMQTTISRSVLRAIARGEKSLSIATNRVGVALDATAMTEIFDVTESSAVIAATVYDVNKLPEDAQSDFKNMPVYEFTITEKKGGEGIALDEGMASFKAAYTLKKNELPDDLAVYQLVDGELTELEEYEYADGWIKWAGDINGIYCVGLK
jgi:hypothetical protein